MAESRQVIVSDEELAKREEEAKAKASENGQKQPPQPGDPENETRN